MSTISITVRDDDIAELQEVTYIQLTEIVETGTSVPGRGAQIGWYIYIINLNAKLFTGNNQNTSSRSDLNQAVEIIETEGAREIALEECLRNKSIW